MGNSKKLFGSLVFPRALTNLTYLRHTIVLANEWIG